MNKLAKILLVGLLLAQAQLLNGSEKSFNQMNTPKSTGFNICWGSTYCEQWVKQAQNKMLLDLSYCFSPWSLKALENGAEHVTFIDITQTDLRDMQDRAYAQDFSKKISCVYADFTQISFFRDSFDSILMSHILAFLNPTMIQKTLNNAYTWLTPGGTLFIITTSAEAIALKKYKALYGKREKGKFAQIDLSKELSQVNHIPTVHSIIACDDLVAMLKSIGFEIITNEKFSISHKTEKISGVISEFCAVVAKKPTEN
ncbi:MAG: class I SAM-dependent methyltransferase [Epsilonproteobacteria bacterium]|nr:class I SAM-dependent methyltransferase [Campylobacterota bacterium]